MTGTVALIRKIHGAVTAEREQRKRRIAEQRVGLLDKRRRDMVKTLYEIEIASVKAAHAAADLARLDAGTAKDCLDEIAASVRGLPCLPLLARDFRLVGVDVTADQLADQIIASMRAVADGRIMSALPPKADINDGCD